MIIKVKSRKTLSFDQLLNYMMAGRGNGDSRSEHDFVHTHNLHGREVEEWIQEFEENETYRVLRRSDSTILTHEIMSWHHGDTPKINRGMLEDITKEYIKHRGLTGMYVAVPHFDKGHVHIHIAVSGVEYRTGKSMRMSKSQFTKLKSIVQEYQIQRYPELEHSVVQHGGRQSRLPIEKQMGHTENQKVAIENVSKRCFKRASSLDEFKNMLAAEGLVPYYRNGKLTGIKQGNRKYRLRRLGLNDAEISKLTDREDRESKLAQMRSTDRANRSRGLDRKQYKRQGGFGGTTPEQDAS